MITSTSNTRVREARRLQRKRQRDLTGLLLVEGLRLLEDVVEAGVTPRHVFYVPAMTDASASAFGLLERFARMGVECLSVSAQVFVTLSQTVTPQGIAAVVPQPHRPLPVRPNLALVLDRVRDPGNAGTLLRSAEAAGVDAALFAPETVDVFNDKVVRAGMGVHFRLTLQMYTEWDQLVAYLNEAVAIYVADVNADLDYDEVDWQRPSALIVGGEASGASELVRTLARPIVIPMHGQTNSLNAAMAGTIILFEAARQRRRASRDAVYLNGG